MNEESALNAFLGLFPAAKMNTRVRNQTPDASICESHHSALFRCEEGRCIQAAGNGSKAACFAPKDAAVVTSRRVYAEETAGAENGDTGLRRTARRFLRRVGGR